MASEDEKHAAGKKGVSARDEVNTGRKLSEIERKHIIRVLDECNWRAPHK